MCNAVADNLPSHDITPTLHVADPMKDVRLLLCHSTEFVQQTVLVL
jgi:hypothetical protein